MLKFYYVSGNDDVAVSQKNIKSKVREFIDLYHMDKYVNNNFKISQVDIINAIGVAIYDKKISHEDVLIIVEELKQEFSFDEEGCLTKFWYEFTPSWDY